MRRPQNKKSKLSRFLSNKLAVTVVVFAVVGTSLLLVARAEKFPDVVNNPSYSNPPINIVNGNADIEVKGQLTNFSPSTTYQANIVFFSDTARVEYASYTCNPILTCVDSDWDRYDNNTSNHMDAKVTDLRVCITIPPGFSIDSSSTILTLHYRVKDTNRPFWLELWHGVATGSCQSNPTASGLDRGDGAYGTCFNMYTSEAGCVGTGGSGTGRQLGKNPYTSSGGTGTGTQGQGTGTGTSPSTGSGGGGGGSSATTQSDNPNSLPSSSDQGTENKQPEVEPSPFFDGKLFAAGSDVYDNANSVSIGGFRLGYGWFYLAGALVLLGVGGFFTWRYRQQLQAILKSLRHGVGS